MFHFLNIARLFLVLILPLTSAFSQNNNEIYVKEIDTVNLRLHLTILTSDSLTGRGTGTAGQKKAANYIEHEFQKLNCSSINGFTQSFKLFKDARSGVISLNDKTLNFPKDFGFFDVYQQFDFDIADFILVDHLDKNTDYSNTYILVQQNDLGSIEPVFENLKCKGIIFILKEYDSRYFKYASDELKLEKKIVDFPILFINQKSLSTAFLKSLKRNAKKKIQVKGSLNTNPSFISTENVIALVEGSDSILKNEVVVISAHYDHLGIKENKTYYGADDNGSGTSALLELASAFQKAKEDGKQPKRSILFIAFTGEELGLLGSTFYTDNPLVSLDNTVANINIDMIGRKTKDYELDSNLMVYMIGANRLSTELDSVIKKTNSDYTNMILDEEYNDVNEPQNLYYRSDHYNFAKNGIPSCFFFGGFHRDYHKPTDTIEKISFEKIAQISRLVFHAVWKIADAPKRLTLIQ